MLGCALNSSWQETKSTEDRVRSRLKELAPGRFLRRGVSMEALPMEGTLDSSSTFFLDDMDGARVLRIWPISEIIGCVSGLCNVISSLPRMI
jgi:hypothetical protein